MVGKSIIKKRGLFLWLFIIFYFASYLIAFLFSLFVFIYKAFKLPLSQFPILGLPSIILYGIGLYSVFLIFKWSKSGILIWAMVAIFGFISSWFSGGGKSFTLVILVIEAIIFILILRPRLKDFA